MKTHVEPEDYLRAETFEQQLEAVHHGDRNSRTWCNDPLCGYEALSDDEKKKNERIALGVLTREGMASKALARRLSAPTATDKARADAAMQKTVAQAVATQKGYMLPASLVTIPSNEYRVVRYKEHPGMYRSEGPGFTAELHRRDHGCVATIRYDGDGGEQRVKWLDNQVGTNGYVQVGTVHACGPQEAAFLLWVSRFEGRWSEEFDLPWSAEGVIATLVEETSLETALNRARTRVPVLVGALPANGVHEYDMFGGGGKRPGTLHILEYFQKRGQDEVYAWLNNRWTRVTDSLRPLSAS